MKIWKFIEKARSADSWYSLLQWPKAFVDLLFPSAITISLSGLVSFVSSYSEWFWNSFGLLGVIGIFFVTAFLTAITWALAIYIADKKINKGKAHETTKSVSREPQKEGPSVKDRSKTVALELNGLEKIYTHEEKNGVNIIKLKFLPDTENCASDSLLVICFLYKHLLAQESINVGFVDQQVADLILHAPNSRRNKIFHAIEVFDITLNPKDYGKQSIYQGFVNRINLARGGSYQITSAGENCARGIIHEMIAHA